MTDTKNAPDQLWVDTTLGFNHAEAFDHPCPTDKRPDDLDEQLYHHDRKYQAALAEIERLQAEVSRLRVVAEAFEELLAEVEGECPSLINEDSGGSDVLISLIIDARQALAAGRKSPKLAKAREDLTTTPANIVSDASDAGGQGDE